MRSDAFNSHIDPVRTEMAGTQYISISHVCDLYESESKGIIAEKNLSKFCFTDYIKSESVIVNESYT